MEDEKGWVASTLLLLKVVLVVVVVYLSLVSFFCEVTLTYNWFLLEVRSYDIMKECGVMGAENSCFTSWFSQFLEVWVPKLSSMIRTNPIKIVILIHSFIHLRSENILDSSNVSLFSVRNATLVKPKHKLCARHIIYFRWEV